MNRSIKLKALVAPYMNEDDFSEAVIKYGIEWQYGVYNGSKYMWFNSYDKDIFSYVPTGETLELLENFSMWYDDGTEEIHITEVNYLDYDSALFYKNRTGKYDPVEEEI